MSAVGADRELVDAVRAALAAAADPDRARAYLEDTGDALSPFSRREAAQHL